MLRKKILVVEDEPSIAALIDYNLKRVGFDTLCVFDGESVFDAIPHFRPDLLVLDLMLPKLDGIQVCKRLREQNNLVPIIMLTALHDLSDKIAGLDNGADDYMTKPFSPQELVARIQAIWRRTSAIPVVVRETMTIGAISIQPEQREVTVNGHKIELTPKEFELLLFLSNHQGKVLSRQQLLHGVWDYHFIGDTRIVDVHISHLREKIEPNPRQPEYIVTIRNVGYKLAGPERVSEEQLARSDWRHQDHGAAQLPGD